MISSLNRLPNGNIEITITIPWKKIKETYEKVLENLAKKVEIKGFRKGKAPKKLVEEKLDKNTLYEEVLKILIPQVYNQAIKQQKIKPIITPQIKIITAQPQKDWQIQIITCELPTVKLGGYKEKVRQALGEKQIWVPGKSQKEKPQTEEEKLGKIFKALLESCQVQIPEILLQEETNRLLSQLVDQATKLGLTIEEYLRSQQKTPDQLRNEYRQQAEETLKLELILSAIAEKQKIEVAETEVEKMINTVTDEEERKKLQTPEKKLYIRQILRKRQVIDFLFSLG